ncbi:MAG: hypothetical protein AAFW76_07200 [Pseudomonadota bacterium]
MPTSSTYTTYRDAAQVISSLRPEVPTYCLAPRQVTANAKAMVSLFPGEVAYAVKCNGDPVMLKALVDGGITSFDVASVPEMALARAAKPDAALHFMHPIKTEQAIRQASADYSVRSFAIDHPDEMTKVLGAVSCPANELTLVVRLSTERGDQAATYDLSAKFGAQPDRAVALLQEIDRAGAKAGLCFHVGSQVLDAAAYAETLHLSQSVIEEAGVALAVLDIGGGFPAAYLDAGAEPWVSVVESAVAGLRRLDLAPAVHLMCEPGRALVADGASLLTKVLLRDDDLIFLNDGAWGAFSEALTAPIRWPAKAYGQDGQSLDGPTKPFRVGGVTCDSCDMLVGTYDLPASLSLGGWVEFGMMGAYSQVLRTDFNGFGDHRVVLVDEPFRPE